MNQGIQAEGTGGDRRLPGPTVRTLRDLLIHPGRTMATLSQSGDLRKGALLVGLLTLVSTILGIVLAFDLVPVLRQMYEIVLWSSPPEEEILRDLLTTVFVFSLVGVPIRWALVTGVLHGLAKPLGGSGSYRSMLDLIGYASVPTLVTTTGSLLIRVGAFAFLGSLDEKTTVYMGLVFLALWCVGMVWGSPGVLSYHALRHGELLSRSKALLVAILAAILLLAAAFGLLILASD